MLTPATEGGGTLVMPLSPPVNDAQRYTAPQMM